MINPTEDEILNAVASRRTGEHTYVIRNILSEAHRGLTTDHVRYRLIQLERAGKVKRVPSQYFANQICWALGEAA